MSDLHERVEKLLGEATPGPWLARCLGGREIEYQTHGDGEWQKEHIPAHVVRQFTDEEGRRHTQFIVGGCTGAGLPNDANAALIAAAPELLRDLLTENKALLAERDELKAPSFVCGLLYGMEQPFVGGCGKTVPQHEAYRCSDCTASFHRDCIREHFKVDLIIQTARANKEHIASWRKERDEAMHRAEKAEAELAQLREQFDAAQSTVQTLEVGQRRMEKLSNAHYDRAERLQKALQQSWQFFVDLGAMTPEQVKLEAKRVMHVVSTALPAPSTGEKT